MPSVKRLRNKVWIALTVSFCALTLLLLGITRTLVQRQTANGIHHTLYTTLIANQSHQEGLLVPLDRTSEQLYVFYSDVPVSSQQNDALVEMALNASDEANLLELDGNVWFYMIALENQTISTSLLYGEQKTIFLNVSSIMQQQNHILFTLSVVALVSLIIISLVSFILSNRFVKPTKLALKQQEETMLLKKRFTANASHEFRTPLSIIKGGFDEVLSNKNQTIESQIKWFDMMDSGIKRVENLTEELLVLAELERESSDVSMEPIDISQCINKIVDTLKVKFNEKTVNIDLVLEPSLLLETNLYKFKQLLMILLDNAFQYVNEFGKIEVNVQKNNQIVQFNIKNSGDGIPAEDLPKVFEHFYRTQSSYGKNTGVGLGLTIAEKVTKQLGGEIIVSSILNEYTNVELRLPKNI